MIIKYLPSFRQLLQLQKNKTNKKKTKKQNEKAAQLSTKTFPRKLTKQPAQPSQVKPSRRSAGPPSQARARAKANQTKPSQAAQPTNQ